MPRISGEDKQRGNEHVFMYVNRHYGLCEKEIAAMVHIHRRTVNNYLVELEREWNVYKDGLIWFVDPEAGSWLCRLELSVDGYLNPVLVSLLIKHLAWYVTNCGKSAVKTIKQVVSCKSGQPTVYNTSKCEPKEIQTARLLSWKGFN